MKYKSSMNTNQKRCTKLSWMLQQISSKEFLASPCPEIPLLGSSFVLCGLEPLRPLDIVQAYKLLQKICDPRTHAKVSEVLSMFDTFLKNTLQIHFVSTNLTNFWTSESKLFSGINHNIDELLVGVFTQISLRQGCPIEDQAKAMNKVVPTNYMKELRNG